jgi:predicted exporter
MNARTEQVLLSKIKALSPQQVAEVEGFVEFLAAKSRKSAALDRLLAIAPALEAAGAPPMSDDEVSTLVAAEIKAARQERRLREQAQQEKQSPAQQTKP